MELKARWNGCSVFLHQGDITKLDVDAVVNAANPRLAGGGGVDGAIHRRGGPTILDECQAIIRRRGKILTAGEAVITGGGNLPARHVIHTVGPVYHQVKPEEAPLLLAACYHNSLALLRERGGGRIAFPCISAGAYGYPGAEACEVALRAVREELEGAGGVSEVVFCTFEEEDYEHYQQAFARSGGIERPASAGIAPVARYRGSLLGLAAGDALGTTVEFCQPGSFKPVETIIGGGTFSLAPGQWTDDTSMALCLAESLVERNGFDARDQMERYCRWHREGYMSSTGHCFDIGGATRAALIRFAGKAWKHEPPSPTPYCGSTDPNTAGNGSIMRLAPVPLFFARRPREAVLRSADSSRTTHAAPAAVDACRYLAALIVGAVRGESKETLLGDHYSPVAGLWHQAPLARSIAEVAGGSFKRRSPPEIQGTGFVVKSLEAALWAFAQSDDFRTGALLAVNLGDDADTTGAVYGQLAGAYYGEDAIPAEWRTVLTKAGLIGSLAERLHRAAQSLPAE